MNSESNFPGWRRRILAWCGALALSRMVAPAMAKSTPCKQASGDAPASRLGAAAVQALNGTQDGGNLCFSPISLLAALTVLWCGAGGTTRALLNQALRIGDSCTPMPDAAHEAARGAAFESATSVWTRRGLALAPGFRASVKDCCNAAVLALPEAQAAEAVNAWVSHATQGKIKRVLNHVSAGTQAIVVNCVYFRASWQHPFNKSHTEKRSFQRRGTDAILVPFMRQVGQFTYQRSQGHQWLRLPYADGRRAMDLLLPEAGTAFAEQLDTLLRLGTGPAAAPKAGRVSLPRFSIASTFELNAALAKMGLGQLFEREHADFSRMAGRQSGLSIDKMTQAAFLAVDEAGTEAGAATTVTFVGALPMPALEFDLRFERPFLLAIRDTADGAVLFIAHITDPQ